MVSSSSVRSCPSETERSPPDGSPLGSDRTTAIWRLEVPVHLLCRFRNAPTTGHGGFALFTSNSIRLPGFSPGKPVRSVVLC